MLSCCSGYSQGQFRLPTHKMQVYENVLRVPFLIKGPGITPGTQVRIHAVHYIVHECTAHMHAVLTIARAC